MQLHKRKRCYGATEDAIPPLSHPSMLHQQQATPMMSQHFLGVTIKQEPMSLSSSCPLSSSKQLKSPPGSCMDNMGCCNNPIPNLGGGPGGPQCMDTDPSSANPSTMSAFLSPQCSPQDSPVGKPTSSSQPPSPNSPYLLSPLLGRDSCGHPHTQGRGHNMQVQSHTIRKAPFFCLFLGHAVDQLTSEVYALRNMLETTKELCSGRCSPASRKNTLNIKLVLKAHS